MFFTNFSKLCNEINKSTTAVGLELGIPKTTVSYWRNNENVIPKAKQLNDIASYFNVSTDYLLGNVDQKKSPTTNSDRLEEDEIKIALFDGNKDIPNGAWEDIKSYIEFIKGKYNI